MTETDVSSYFAQFNPTQQQLKKLTSLVRKARKVWGHDYSNYGQRAAEEAMLAVAPGELSQLTPAAYHLLKRCQRRIWAFKVRLEEKYGIHYEQTYKELLDLLLSLGLIAEATPRQKLKGSKTVKELRSLLDSMGLSTSGKKDTLVGRIIGQVSLSELDALVTDVILFRTTDAGDQAVRNLDELHRRMRFAFVEAVMATPVPQEVREEPPPALPPGVLYDDGDVIITEADVERAIEEGRQRVGDEFAALLEAEPQEETQGFLEGDNAHA